MAFVIFLHGASSSGKSTLAKALQREIDAPFWHVSFDKLRETGVLPMDRLSADWSGQRGQVFSGLHASFGAYAGAGNNLIIEHILDTEGWQAELQRQLEGHAVLFIGVHCGEEELARREAARGDRAAGSAVNDARRIHAGRRYDLDVNSEDGLAAQVGAILELWRAQPAGSAFWHAAP